MRYKIGFIGNSNHKLTRMIAHHLAQRGHQVHLISYNKSIGQIQNENPTVSFHSFQRFIPNYLSFIQPTKEMRIFIKKSSFDIIHGFQITNYGMLAAQLNFHPYVLSTLGSDIFFNPSNGPFYRKFILKKVMKFAVSQADSITVETEIGKNVLESYLHVPSGKIKIIKFGIEIENFSQKPLSGHRNVTVVSPRAVTKLYNIDLIVRSIPHCRKQIPAIKFIFLMGIGNDRMITYILELAKQLNVHGSIEFIHRILNYKEIAEVYSKADILVSIPTSDSLPKSVLEGVLCNTIPVLSDIPANRNLLDFKIPAIFTSIKNEKKLAERIVATAADLPNLQQRVKVARRTIIENFSMKKSIDIIEELYAKHIH
jgi:glycosyltransferase involved in cell wall biosynthesis